MVEINFLKTIDFVGIKNNAFVNFLRTEGVIRKVVQRGAGLGGEDSVEFIGTESAIDALIEEWLCNEDLADLVDTKAIDEAEWEAMKAEAAPAPAPKLADLPRRRVSMDGTSSTAQKSEKKATTEPKVRYEDVIPAAAKGEERIATVTMEDGKYVARYNDVVLAKINRPEDLWGLLVINRWTQKAKHAAITDFDWKCIVSADAKVRPVATAKKPGRQPKQQESTVLSKIEAVIGNIAPTATFEEMDTAVKKLRCLLASGSIETFEANQESANSADVAEEQPQQQSA